MPERKGLLRVDAAALSAKFRVNRQLVAGCRRISRQAASGRLFTNGDRAKEWQICFTAEKS